MNIGFTKYRTFIRVVELGSLTKAAAEMGYSQPGVSKMLDSLENELGITLLIRKNTSVEPTEEGKQVLKYCREIVKHENDLSELVNSMKGLITGSIRIGSLNSMLMNYVPKIISSYSVTYPNIELSLNEIPFAEIVKQLLNNDIDIGFTSEFKVKGLEFYPQFYPFFNDPIYLITNKNHPFASYSKVPISALNGVDFIMPEEGWDDPVITASNKKKFTPVIKYRVQ